MGLSGLSGMSGMSGIINAFSYFLDDRFITDRAAGAVNGTTAEPGPGTRVVVDTGSRVVITGGNLSFAGGGGAGDPSYWLDGISNVAGAVLLAEITPADVTGIRDIGWDSNQISSMIHGVRAFNADLLISSGGVGGATVGTISAVSHILAVVSRGSGNGFYPLIKGGIYTDWTLLWIDASAFVMATTYPNMQARNAATCSYVRISVPTWLPIPLAYDTFTRANGALGSSETTGPDSQAVIARTWNNRVGTTLIATNAASASALVGGIAIATVDTATADTIVSATLTRAGDEAGVVLRYADADNYIRAIHDGTNCKLIKRVATVESDVISAAVAIGAGAIRVIPSGTSFSLYLNGAQVGSTSTISDAGLQTGTEQGLFSSNTGSTQDDFEVFPYGTGGEHSSLSGLL